MQEKNQRNRTALKCALGASILAVGLLVGCGKKEAKEDSMPLPDSHLFQPMTMSRPATLSVFEPNTMSWQEMAVGYDETNIRYNKAKLYLSIGLAEVAKDPVIAAWIVSEAKAHEDNVFYFDLLFEKFPDTKAIMEQTVDPLGEMTGWTFEQVQSRMQYDGYNIKASIYLTNTAIADASLRPMVTPGYDIIQADEKHPSDVVLGWYINEANQVSRINLWKEIVTNVAAPVFAIDGRATNRQPLHIVSDFSNEPDDGSESVGNRSINAKIILKRFQICKRYEMALQGNSEYKLTGKGVYLQYPGAVTPQFHNLPSGIWLFLRNDCNGQGLDEWEDIPVNKNQVDACTPQNIYKYFAKVNGTFNLNVIGCDFDYFEIPSATSTFGQPGPYSRKRLYFNTYENDGWPTSQKPLSPATINGQPLGLKGRMGTYSEWYQFDPNNPAHWMLDNTFTINSNILSGAEVTKFAPAEKGGYVVFGATSGCY